MYAHPSELRSQEVGIRRVSELLDFGSSNGIPIYGTQLRSDLAGIPYYPLRKEFAKYVTSGRMINKDHEDSFQDTELHKILQQDGVTDLVVVGYNLNACVIQTVRTALELGYWVIVSPHHLFWNRYSVFEDTLEELRTTSDYYETANLLLEHLKTILIKD